MIEISICGFFSLQPGRLLRFSIDLFLLAQTVIRLIRGQHLVTLTVMQCCDGLGVTADRQPEHVPLNLSLGSSFVFRVIAGARPSQNCVPDNTPVRCKKTIHELLLPTVLWSKRGGEKRSFAFQHKRLMARIAYGQLVIPIQRSLADHRQLYPEGETAGSLCVGSRTYEAGALPGIHHRTVDQGLPLAAENRLLRDQLRDA